VENLPKSWDRKNERKINQGKIKRKEDKCCRHEGREGV
jgi:hypothetical protein